MEIRALKNFCGTITMSKGEVRECKETEVVKDLLKVGYIEKVRKTKNESKCTHAGVHS